MEFEPGTKTFELAGEGDRIFTTTRARELAPAAGLSNGYLRQALHHLTSSGWLVRLRKGLYALSSSVPGATPAHEFEIAMALVHPAAVSHWSALHDHGLTEQAPRKVFVLTTTETSVPRARGAGARQGRDGYRVCGNVYGFIQVKPERFFGTGSRGHSTAATSARSCTPSTFAPPTWTSSGSSNTHSRWMR